VATRNRSRRLLDTLATLLDAPDPPPIVVVDNASSDGTPDAVRERYPEVELVPLARNLGAAARTVGAWRLGTPFVAFSDDDSWWAPGALELAADAFGAYPRLGLIASRMLVGSEERLDPTCERMADSPLPRDEPLPGPPVLGFVACGAVVRRRAFLGVGGFHPRLGMGAEETLAALDLAAAGWRLAYVDAVVAHHHPDPGPRQGRVAMTQRNLLWSAWLRLPPGSAIRETAATVARARTDSHARTALGEALRGAAWVARERRRVPRRVSDAYGSLVNPNRRIDMAESQTKSDTRTTTDHDEIRRWVEEHGGTPAMVKGTEGGDRAGVLRIDFPGGADEGELEHISWDEWFDKFEKEKLAFLYQERKADGDDSTFFKLVSR
jgi:GT2 family glycosyltransferase